MDWSFPSESKTIIIMSRDSLGKIDWYWSLRPIPQSNSNFEIKFPNFNLWFVFLYIITRMFFFASDWKDWISFLVMQVIQFKWEEYSGRVLPFGHYFFAFLSRFEKEFTTFSLMSFSISSAIRIKQRVIFFSPPCHFWICGNGSPRIWKIIPLLWP